LTKQRPSPRSLSRFAGEGAKLQRTDYASQDGTTLSQRPWAFAGMTIEEGDPRAGALACFRTTADPGSLSSARFAFQVGWQGLATVGSPPWR